MRKVRLTEGQLHHVIRESVNNILNEISDELKKKSYEKAKRLGREDQADYFANSQGDFDKFDRRHGGGFIPDFNDKYAIDSNDFKTYADYSDGYPTLHSLERKQSTNGFLPNFLQKKKWGGYAKRLGDHFDTTFDREKKGYISNDPYHETLPGLNHLSPNDYNYKSNLNNRSAFRQARDAWEKLGNVHSNE